MTVPKAKNIDRTALFIWNDSNSEYEAWDGVLEAGDLQIGAVEIKDGDSATRLDVETDSAKNAAYVQSESLAQESGGNLATIAGDTTSIDGKVALAANQLADGHNVTVDNASGASAVNVQDGGNSLTVDAVDLDIRNLSSAQDDVSVTTVKPDGTNTMPSGDATARPLYVKLTDSTTDSAVTTNNELKVLNSDINLEIARGNISGMTSVNKAGRATNVDINVDTDIWDRANAANDQDIWTAPTQARTHQIKSSSASDDGSPAGVGARTVRIYGLTGWSTAEVTEDITMNGTSNVATANSYVIIHHMEVLTKGATNVNVGTITATADTDSTVTAMIFAGQGESHMAIYGIPDIQTAYMTGFFVSINKANLATTAPTGADISLLFNPEADSELTNFVSKQLISTVNRGNTTYYHLFKPYRKFAGPGILKIQARGAVDNTDISAGFDLILIDN